MSIEFRDPPERTARNYNNRWMTDLLPLIERCGEWACICTKNSERAATSTASNFRRRAVFYPPGKWEFRAEGLEVFARYIGPG